MMLRYSTLLYSFLSAQIEQPKLSKEPVY